MIKFAPKAQLSANTDDWDPYYIARVQAVLDGTWKSEDTWGGMKDGMVVLAPFTNMPDDVKKMAEDSVAKIKSGELQPFTGPITKQDGTTVGEAGKPLPDGELLGMNYYIKGIDDKLPQ
jgi:simple sugar transport system substrate-binding protein